MDVDNEAMFKAGVELIQEGFAAFAAYGIKEDGECGCGRISCPDMGKHPATPNGFKNATKNPEELRRQFENAPPRCNLAAATGLISSITVIDLDIANGKHGAETWSALIAEKGEPHTLMVRTGSGGLHIFFKYNCALKTGTNRLGLGLDVRNDGAYIIVPPSRHRSGGVYEWL